MRKTFEGECVQRKKYLRNMLLICFRIKALSPRNLPYILCSTVFRKSRSRGSSLSNNSSSCQKAEYNKICLCLVNKNTYKKYFHHQIKKTNQMVTVICEHHKSVKYYYSCSFQRQLSIKLLKWRILLPKLTFGNGQVDKQSILTY